MDSSEETQTLKDPSGQSPAVARKETQPETTANNAVISLILQPFQWLRMLSSELNPTFVLGIFLVYGLSQGFSGSFFRVVSDYYWKDVQKVQPSDVQLFTALYYVPWVMKPLWGLLTDVFPVRGYRRRPYFVLAGVLGAAAASAVGEGGKLTVGTALGCLVGVSAAVAIADVTIDACIARNSIEMKQLAPDMQSLCGVCSSAGALIGYSTSGFFVDHLGPQISFRLLAIPPALIVGLGFVIHEPRTEIGPSVRKQAVMEGLGRAVRGMQKTIRLPQVWKPSLYMYLSLALSISTHEGQFYWYTNPTAGPAFSQEFVGMIYAIGAMASIVGVLIYHKFLKDYPFRSLIFFAQLLYATSGMLDIVFVFRWNLRLRIPDYFFVVLEECVSRIVSRIRWMPMIVLSTRLVLIGIEGTFFALLMSIDSLGSLSSKWGGGIILRALHVTRIDFKNLWLALLVRNLLRFATLGLIFLVPNASHLDDLVSSEQLPSSGKAVDGENDESLQLVPLHGKSEV